MSRQTKSISENEKKVAELEGLYHSVESQIGLVILNSYDAARSLSKESLADSETFLKLEKEKDDYNRIAQEIREHAEQKKECAVELSQLKKTINAQSSRHHDILEDLGTALTEQYSELFDDFFADSYKRICDLQKKITFCEQALSEVEQDGGFIAAIQTTFKRSSKKTNLVMTRQKLSKALIAEAKAAFSAEDLKNLFDAKKLPSQVEKAYKAVASSENEMAALVERADQLDLQIKDDADFIKNSGISAGKNFSAQIKISELDKAISKNAIVERIILSRIGKRFSEPDLAKRAMPEELSSVQAKEAEVLSADEDKETLHDDLLPLIAQLGILRDEMDACKKAIEQSQREIEIIETNKTINSLRTQVNGTVRKIDKLSNEKTNIEDELKVLAKKIEDLQQKQ
jgi:chromosome segregation ATPase